VGHGATTSIGFATPVQFKMPLNGEYAGKRPVIDWTKAFWDALTGKVKDDKGQLLAAMSVHGAANYANGQIKDMYPRFDCGFQNIVSKGEWDSVSLSPATKK
jgi:hypothetical protein